MLFVLYLCASVYIRGEQSLFSLPAQYTNADPAVGTGALSLRNR
jgi:hypothetical protein